MRDLHDRSRLQRFIDARGLTVAELAMASIVQLQIADPHGRHDDPATFYREWSLAHIEMHDDVPALPTVADDQSMGLPDGFLETGMGILLQAGKAARMPDGHVALIMDPILLH